MPVTASRSTRDRVRALHNGSLVVDATCPRDYWVENFDKWLAGGVSCCFVTVGGWESCRDAVASIADLYKLVRDNDNRLVVATSTREIRQAKTDGKLAVVMQFQGTHPIEYDENLVELFWRLGIRVVQLAYNQRSPVCDGCEEPGNAGLSGLGVRVLGELNRLAIAVDLSHTGVRASFEALDISTSPCIVSHANAKALCASNRNLSDDLIRAVVEKGGVIGLNGFPAFVSTKQAPSLDDLIDHLVHIESIAGSGHVGLGIDYYQASMTEYEKLVAEGVWRPETYPAPPFNYPTGIENPSTLERLTDRLVERGFTDDEVRGVLGENWMRILDQIWSNREPPR